MPPILLQVSHWQATREPQIFVLRVIDGGLLFLQTSPHEARTLPKTEPPIGGRVRRPCAGGALDRVAHHAGSDGATPAAAAPPLGRHPRRGVRGRAASRG